jgi:hypothetical protein
VKGHLSAQWADWFGELEIKNQPNGNAELSGPLPDQAALYGVLNQLRDLGLVLNQLRDLGLALISVNCVEREGDQN